ncbi:hypothetical protein JM16_006477 [Phytophthora kernoviae]|uniref:Multidrug and toxin extrusion protein n=1 Tax=Phytophthora kernoviae TaxID=325452 RepID=A0A8T0LTC1_9STRA|nr:hypothetical protein JM16_006477 [Phytophthora kernoviae]
MAPRDQLGEKSLLLPTRAVSTTEEIPVDVKAEFLGLSSIALQVSLATFARIALYSIDYAFLGHLGTTELAAASLASVWTTVPLLTVWSSMSAIVTLCGQAWGAGNGKLTGIWLQMGLALVTLCTPVLMLFYWFVGFGLRASTDDDEVVRLGIRFSRILMFSIWPNLVYVCLRLYFQAMGVMMPTTVVGTLSMGVSITANYIFIYGIWGWTGIGFDGSALATVAASWFQPLALAWYCVVYKKMHLQAWSGWDLNEFTRERMTVFYNNCAPAAVNSLVSNVASSSLSLIAAWLGADIIAANAIVSGFWRLLWALFWGFGSGTQIRVSNLLGANRPKAAKTLGMLGFGCTVITVSLLALVTLFFRSDVFRLYTNDSNLLDKCASVLPIFVVAFMVEATEMVFASILSAMGQVHITAWTSTLATWMVELPAAYVLAIVLDGGFAALWYSICIMEVLKLSVYAVVLQRIDFANMARDAVKNMEVEDESKEVSVAVAEGGTTALGANTGLPSPVPTTLMTPSGLVHQWDHVDDVVQLGVRFARILSLSVWPSLAYCCVRLYFQSMGIMMPVTVVGTLSIGVATAANYALIYGAYGFDGLGFDGSPMATVIAAWFQPIALVSYCIFYKKMHLQAWGGWDFSSFTPDRLKITLNIAGPMAANSMVSNLANSALTLVAAQLGSEVIAANAIISGLWSLLWALFWGFGSATQIRVANLLGANRPKAARVLGFLGFMCTVITVLVLAIVSFLLRESLFQLYSNDNTLLQLCMLVQPIFITGYVIQSMEILVSSILAGMGEVSVTAWASSASVWCIELPIAYVGGVTMGLGFPALWYGVCAMEVVKLFVFVYVLSRVDWAEMAWRAIESMESTTDVDGAASFAVKFRSDCSDCNRHQWSIAVVGTLSLGLAMAANYALVFGVYGFSWGGWDFASFTPDRLKIFLNIAAPLAANSVASSFANSALTLVAAKLGSEVIAANAAISGLWYLLWALFWGFGSATQIRVANLLGANRPKAARVLGFLGLSCTIATVLALAITTFLLRESLFHLYSNDDTLVQMCMLAQPIFIIGYMIESMEILISSALAVMGEVKVTAWTSSLSVWFIELPTAYVGGVVLGFGFRALWFGVCVMEVVKLSIFVLVLSRVDWTVTARCAIKNMEANIDNDSDIETESLHVAMSGRKRQWDQIEDQLPFLGIIRPCNGKSFRTSQDLSTDDAEVVYLGVRFARILSLSIWPSLVYACFRLYFQSMGIMSPVTVVGTLSIGVAVAANYFLIFGAFGWAGLGFDGSPMSTVIAAWFQPIALIGYCIFYKKMHLQAWGGWDFTAFTPDRLKIFFNIAGPIAANSVVSNLANSALTLVAAKLGSDIIAANAVISGLWSLLWALFWGYGSATQIRVANYLGAGRPKAARVLGFLGFLCTVVTVVTLAIASFLLRESLFRLYSNDDTLLQLCMLVQPIFITGYMIESIEILTSSILAGMGEVSVAAWTSSLSVWLIELPIAYFGGVTLGFGFQALWYGVCMMEVLKLSVFVFVLSRTDWSEMSRRAVDNMEANNDNDSDIEAESLHFAMAEGGNTPGNVAPVVRSPAAQGLMTPSGRKLQWDQIEDGTRLRSPFFGGTPRSDTFSERA